MASKLHTVLYTLQQITSHSKDHNIPYLENNMEPQLNEYKTEEDEVSKSVSPLPILIKTCLI